jgi:hypothetical protein
VKIETKKRIFLSSLEKLTKSEDFSESHIKHFVPVAFPETGRFSSVFIPYWMQEKSAKMYMSLFGDF